jgi:ABC-type antimicrobial peptide transport system permease subunit
MEATGIYYEQLAWFLHNKNYSVSVVLPNKAKKYKEALGLKSKNDRIDAKGLAQMACEQNNTTWKPLTSNIYLLRLITRQIQSVAEQSTVKINGTNLAKTLNEVKDAWQISNMAYPFGYNFLDDRLKTLYSSDEKLGSIFSKFSLIALFITCIGLFGISILILEQRTKEIGIRKVLGATVRDIVVIVSKDFLKLVFIASFIAFPVAAYFMHNWLQNFAYRINLSWWIFAGAALVALAIALFTICFQAIKAAIANPVKSLRTE